MACVLTVTQLHTSQFRESGVILQSQNCTKFDWLNSKCNDSGFSKGQACFATGRIATGQDSSKACQVHVYSDSGCYLNINSSEIGRYALTKDKQDVSEQSKHVKRALEESEHLRKTNKHGFKRKAEFQDPTEVPIPSKRITPFLNTPKERKDEQKKMLKISVKKLKQIDDPETFLRRTVLVNNTMKQLQKELRAETQRHTKRRFNDRYGALNNNCMLESYLVDDPFLSGIHEKITDDMTDTFIHNVFHDSSSDKSNEPKSDIILEGTST